MQNKSVYWFAITISNFRIQNDNRVKSKIINSF